MASPKSTPWVFLEAAVLSKLGALRADDEATGNTSFKTVPKTANEADDGAFSRAAVRAAIVDTVLEVAATICRVKGHPRRQLYKLTAEVDHAGTLPASLGAYDAIYEESTRRSLVPRKSPSEIESTRRLMVPPGVLANLPCYFYCIDGTTLYHTLSGKASVEYFNVDRPAATFANVDALFNDETTIAPIPDELALPVADGAAGRLCMNAASMVQEGAAFLNAYSAALREHGLSQGSESAS